MNEGKEVKEVATMKGRAAMTYPWRQGGHVLGGERSGHSCSSYTNELNLLAFSQLQFSLL